MNLHQNLHHFNLISQDDVGHGRKIKCFFNQNHKNAYKIGLFRNLSAVIERQRISSYIHLLLKLPDDLLVGVHPPGDPLHVVHQDPGASRRAADPGGRPVDRPGYAGDGDGDLVNRALQPLHPSVVLHHGLPDVVRILPVLLPRLDGPLQLLGDHPAQIAGQLPGVVGQVFHRPCDHPADLLNVAGGLRAGIGQLVDLLRHHGEPGPRRPRPGGLDGGVDGDEVGGGGYVEDILGEGPDLVHAVALFNGLVQHGHDVRRLVLDHLCLQPGGPLHLLRPLPHPGGVGRDGGALLRHALGVLLGSRRAGGDGRRAARHLLQGGGELLRQLGQGAHAVVGVPRPLAHLSHHAADPLRAVLEGAHGVPDGGEHIPADDPEGRRHQENAHHQGDRAGDQGDDVHQGEPPLGLPRLLAHRVGQGVDLRLRRPAPARHVPVGGGVGLLGLAVRAGTDQIDQGVLKLPVAVLEGLIRLPLLFRDKLPVGFQLFVQGGLLRLDLLHQLDHGGVIRRHDVGQGQAVDIHDGPPDVLQPLLAGHAAVHDPARVGVDVVDAEYRQKIGQQGDQAQQDNGQDQPLLKCQSAFHAISSR